MKVKYTLNQPNEICTLLVAVWPSPNFIRSLHFCRPLITPIFISRSAVGHFSFPNLAAYSALSTLFDWLWMWAASAARQCVCDLDGLFHFRKKRVTSSLIIPGAQKTPKCPQSLSS